MDPTKFRSAARPSARLNDRELQQLRLGRAFHKPRQDAAAGTLLAQRLASPAEPTSSRRPRRPKDPEGDDSSYDTRESVFITQSLATEDDASRSLGKDRAASKLTDSKASALIDIPSINGVENSKTSNKTVTFAGLPSPTAGSKRSLNVKRTPRPLTVATDRSRDSAGKFMDNERPRPKSLTQDSADEDRSSALSRAEKSESEDKGEHQVKEGEEKKMIFLNTLLEETGNP